MSNSKKKENKTFGIKYYTYWRIGLSHARIYMISWSVVYFDEINDMKVSNLSY